MKAMTGPLARCCAVIGSAVTLLALVGIATASPVTMTLPGTVTYVSGPQVSVLDGLIAVGDPVIASLTYDTATPDSSPAWPLRGDFFHSSGPAGIVANINGHIFATDFLVRPLWVFTADQFFDFADILGWQGGSSPAASPGGPLRIGNAQMEVQLQDLVLPLDFLASDALPASPDISLVNDARGSIFMGWNSSTGEYAYNINFSLTPPAAGEPTVPGPASLALLGIGFATGLGCRLARAARGSRPYGRNPAVRPR